MLYCKYCGKECKNLNSLRQHEIRCKENPNRIKISTEWNKSEYHKGVSSTKGLKAVTDGIHNKYILPDEIDNFLLNNPLWRRGSTPNFKNKPTGVCSTPEKEAERRRKISETMKKNPLAGGRRIGSGRGKQGWYKGFYCDSSWELAFLTYYIDHNMNIKRCEERREYFYNNEKHTYIPDFITDEGIVEIKGYNTNLWKAKIELNPDIKVLYEDDIKLYLNYVIEKYGNKFYETLYEKNV